MNSFIDTHCHLEFDLFDDDREKVLERAHSEGVIRILNPGIDLPTSRLAISLAEKHPEVYVAIGVHPNESQSWDEMSLVALRSLAAHPKVVAVGEIGLDYYRNRSPVTWQKKVLRAQLDLATELNLPVVLHNRDASDDLFEILGEWLTDLDQIGTHLRERPGVLHSYTGDSDNAHQAITLGFFLGLGGPITFQNAREFQKNIAQIPLESILIETDAPFLAPHPHRGKRNEPAYVTLVAGKIAELQGVSLKTVAAQTTQNANQLFKWREVF